MEVCDFLAEHDPVVGRAMGKDAAKNALMAAPQVQKDIAEGFAHVIVQSILKEVQNNVFFLLVDESRDASCKEKMVWPCSMLIVPEILKKALFVLFM